MLPVLIVMLDLGTDTYSLEQILDKLKIQKIRFNEMPFGDMWGASCRQKGKGRKAVWPPPLQTLPRSMHRKPCKVMDTSSSAVCLVIASTVQYLECSLLLLVLAASDLPRSITIKFCYVVFGVTLRFLAINSSSSCLLANSKRRRLPAMSATNFPRSGKARPMCITLGGRPLKTRDEARYRSRIAFCHQPYLHSRPALLAPRRHIVILLLLLLLTTVLYLP